MKILIVDDDTGILNALRIGLTGFGYEVVVAENGDQALKIIGASIEAAEPVDIMVTDLRMPDMNGLELIRLSREEKPGLAAILMTANGDDSIREEARNLGGCEYIEKPFGLNDILKVIRDFESAA